MNISIKDDRVPGEMLRSSNRLARITLHILLPLFALVCGLMITLHLLNTGPKAQPKKKVPTAILVEIQIVSRGPQHTILSAMGEIIPDREIEIKPRVSGEVSTIDKDFLPGGYFLANDKMLSIDRTDYKLVARQLESDVAKAKSDLAMEMGNQRIAEREFKLLDESVSEEEKNLILRMPQLDKLQATRDYAQSKLDQARLNLERTEIKAPFNGVITSQIVDAGTKVTESTVLAKIVGTDTFRLRLTLPVEQLRWLNIPANSEEKGSTVKIFSQGDTSAANYREGQVIRLIPALEEQGRMAQLLVRIDDPLCRREENRGRPRLLLGSYVRAEIEGITVGSGFLIERSNIHDGNTVWLMDNNGMLDIRKVEVIFHGRDHVIISSGLEDGERLVTSALSSPISGIPLRLEQGSEDLKINGPESSKERNGNNKRGGKRAE